MFQDAYGVGAAAFMPGRPDALLAGNAAGVLRVYDVRQGRMTAKLQAPSDVRALASDASNSSVAGQGALGGYVFGGTKLGELFAIDAATLRLRPDLALRVSASYKGMTDLQYFSKEGKQGRESYLLAACLDCTLALLRVHYDAGSGVCTGVHVAHRFPNAHELLPLRCLATRAPANNAADGRHEEGEDNWFALTASEDGHVHVHTLDRPFRHVCSIPHSSPAVALATNASNTLLATADIGGELCFWRRYS